MPETTYQLGDRVTFAHTLKRERRWTPGLVRQPRRWEPVPFTPSEGVIAGVRILSNGHVLDQDYESSGTYVGVHYFRAYLVAYHLRKKPVLVLPVHLDPVGGLVS